ncbi:MAG: histidine phosphatase family protein [Alphaproteobacteria bacterium]|nr:histidine phosphatase family protein [Alphaproteobacteria bacterium]MCL2890053.1 histidine phosphatase family protein [Alphaproteobacteria bacterium]
MGHIENIFLVRHARSLRNEGLGTEYADCDVPLANVGPTQSIRAGQILKSVLPIPERIESKVRFSINGKMVDVKPKGKVVLWSSTYRRALQTREGIGRELQNNHRTELKDSTLLREQSFGIFDGMSKQMRFARYPFEARQYAMDVADGGKFFARPSGGESYHDVYRRMHRFMDIFERYAHPHWGRCDNHVIVSHGIAIRAFLMMALHKSPEWMVNEPDPNNASIRHLTRDASGRFKDMGYIFGGFPYDGR